MKTIARIATATVAAIASLFIAAPAFANEGGGHDPLTTYSTAGEPLQVWAILIVGAVLLVLVLLLAQSIGNAFEKKN